MFSWLERFANKKMEDFYYFGNSRFRFGIRLGWMDRVEISGKQVIVSFCDGRVHELNFGTTKEAHKAFNEICKVWDKYL